MITQEKCMKCGKTPHGIYAGTGYCGKHQPKKTKKYVTPSVTTKKILQEPSNVVNASNLPEFFVDMELEEGYRKTVNNGVTTETCSMKGMELSRVSFLDSVTLSVVSGDIIKSFKETPEEERFQIVNKETQIREIFYRKRDDDVCEWQYESPEYNYRVITNNSGKLKMLSAKNMETGVEIEETENNSKININDSNNDVIVVEQKSNKPALKVPSKAEIAFLNAAGNERSPVIAAGIKEADRLKTEVTKMFESSSLIK